MIGCCLVGWWFGGGRPMIPLWWWWRCHGSGILRPLPSCCGGTADALEFGSDRGGTQITGSDDPRWRQSTTSIVRGGGRSGSRGGDAAGGGGSDCRCDGRGCVRGDGGWFRCAQKVSYYNGFVQRFDRIGHSILFACIPIGNQSLIGIENLQINGGESVLTGLIGELNVQCLIGQGCPPQTQCGAVGG